MVVQLVCQASFLLPLWAAHRFGFEVRLCIVASFSNSLKGILWPVATLERHYLSIRIFWKGEVGLG